MLVVEKAKQWRDGRGQPVVFCVKNVGFLSGRPFNR
jgi:hypothetical protein